MSLRFKEGTDALPLSAHCFPDVVHEDGSHLLLKCEDLVLQIARGYRRHIEELHHCRVGILVGNELRVVDIAVEADRAPERSKSKFASCLSIFLE